MVQGLASVAQFIASHIGWLGSNESSVLNSYVHSKLRKDLALEIYV